MNKSIVKNIQSINQTINFLDNSEKFNELLIILFADSRKYIIIFV